jgi:hypothetical protein
MLNSDLCLPVVLPICPLLNGLMQIFSKVHYFPLSKDTPEKVFREEVLVVVW